MRQVWDRVHIEAVVLVNSAHLGDIARYVACSQAGLAQSVERQALNLMVGGSSPPVGVLLFNFRVGGNSEAVFMKLESTKQRSCLFHTI